MSEPRLRRCTERGEYERAVDDLAVQGYKIKSRSDSTALLEKASYGSGGMHVLLFCLTFGIGNLIYAAVKYAGRDRVTIRLDSAPTSP